jgi:Tfp pilus assembly protein PilF
MLPVFVEDCEATVAMAHIKQCALFGLSQDDARARLEAYLSEARLVRFPGEAKTSEEQPVRPETIDFPGRRFALSNIAISVPLHFLGRDDELAAIDAALTSGDDRVVIVALYGLRGVGKTTLAAAYAQRHKADYRATWWIRAQTESTMRADLVSLGARLGWVAADEKEETALETVRERLRDEGEGLLLVFDNAVDAASIRPYLPTGGAARVLVTSNSPAWRRVGTPVEVRVWSKEVGADYLMARTGRDKEWAGALALSQALGGLTLAHEQAAAYCERLGVSLSDYRKRFEATSARLLDMARDASADYHGGLTVAKAFALAIDEAAKLNPAAEPLIYYAALLAPEPIPLFLFSEAREKFGEPLASDLAGDGLDEAVAALRAFALVDRETIADERDPEVTTETIRLHRLVRIAAASRRPDDAAEASRRVLIEAMASVYPRGVDDDPSTWARARRLDALALDLVASPDLPPVGGAAGYLLNQLALYRYGALGAYAEAQPLFERALAIDEKMYGLDHSAVATDLNNLAFVLMKQGDLAGAWPLYERALVIREKAFGTEHPEVAQSLDNLALLFQAQGDLAAARPLYERALAILEKALDREHPDIAAILNNLAAVLQDQGDLAGARPLHERALAIREKVLGSEHPDTAQSLNNLAGLVQAQGDLAGARPIFERALAVDETVYGTGHPDVATDLNNLANLLQAQGDLAGALPLYQRALAICEQALGPQHPKTAVSLDKLAGLLLAQGDPIGARPLFERALAIKDEALGPEHPDTATSVNNLASLLRAQGDLKGARPLFERACATYERTLGVEHSSTATSLANLAGLLQAQGNLKGARPLYERALAIFEKALGPEHPSTATSLNNLAGLFVTQGDLGGARPLYQRAIAIKEKALGPEHPSTAASLNNLALVLQAQGDLAGARQLFERASSICEKALGPEHPDTIRVRDNLAELRRTAGARPKR